MQLEQFIEKWNNKTIDFDGAYGPQCMDLMHQYLLDVFWLPREVLQAPTAYQAYEKGHSDFVHVSSKELQSGDLVFWNKEFIPSTGHVAVFIEHGKDGFISFDQNWPVGSICHVQGHSWQGVAGGLRHKSLMDNQSDMTTEEKDMLVRVDRFVTELKKAVEGFRQRETDGALFLDAKTTDKKAEELRGTVYADSRALAALMRAAGTKQITEEEAKKDKYVRVKSARDFDK